MNVPISTVGSQLYVQFPSAVTAPFENIPQASQNDVHICGVCKQNFSDINLFVEHKRSSCIQINNKVTATTSALLEQPALSYISTSSETSTSPHIFRVIVDASNLSVQPGGSTKSVLSSKQNGDSNILRSRLLGIQDEQQVGGGLHQNSNTASPGLQTTVMHQQSRREFQIDEEAVATILANQLANEDVSSTHSRLPSEKSGPIFVLGNMDTMMIQDCREQDPLNIGSIDLSDSDAVALRLQAEQKQNSCNKESGDYGASEMTDRLSKNESKKPASREEKDMVWSLTNEKKCTKVASPVVCSLSSITAELCTPNLGLSTVSRTKSKKRHECTFDGCGFSTCYLKDLVRHVRRHTGERPFQCDTCHRTFSRGDKLQMHLRIHSGVKPHRCEQCDYATIDSGSLRKHMRIHNDERPYKCQICPYRSRDSSQLTVHLRTHTGDNPFVCPYDSCTSAFKTSSDLKRHARMHTGEKPFACEFCDYKCAIKSNLSVHMRLNHTEVKPFPCNTCSHVSTSKRAAKEHEKSHADEVLKCGVCAYTCVNTSSMKSHLRTHTQNKPFSCKHCVYTCRLQGNLKAHLKKKHSDIRVLKKGKSILKDTSSEKVGFSTRIAPKSLVQSKPYCYKSYKCTSCDAAFVREDSWRSHMRQHQTQDMVLSNATQPTENSAKQRKVTHSDNCEQGRDSTVIESGSSGISTDTLEQDTLRRDTQNLEQKETAKSDKQLQKSRDELGLNESLNKDKDKESVKKVGQLTQTSDRDNTQPMLLYVQSPPTQETVDDSLRSAEILASLNQVAPILLAGRQYIIPTDQNIVEQLAASLQPGNAYQYILSSPLEGMVSNEGTFIHASAGNDSEMTSHVDTTIHIPPVIPLHMEKQSLLENN